MRIQHVVMSLVVGLVVSSPAAAVLKHYSVHWTGIAEFNTQNPSLNKQPNLGTQPTTNAIVDDAVAGSPVLKKLNLVFSLVQTTNVPALAGFIFRSQLKAEGPKKGTSFTGTGTTSSTIAWGLVTGWTVTGGVYCHSSPSFICTYASSVDLATVDPAIFSPFYDLGTWSFHGTGFTSTPYMYFEATPAQMTIGNSQTVLRGRLSAGLIPAIPVLGVSLLGASLLFVGARLARKR